MALHLGRGTRRIMSLLAASSLLVVLIAVPATADSPWYEVEIESGDFTRCEFEPGVFTWYEVDDSTLPQYDRQLVSETELPDGSVRLHFGLKRSAIQFLKVDPYGLGPDVLIESGTINLMVVTASDGEIISLKGTVTNIERTPDGRLVDLNNIKWWGFDGSDPIVVSHTGVCNN